MSGAKLPRLTRSDSWLLAAVGDGRRKPRNTEELIENADWLNRAIPTFDEISFGIPRLVAAGLLRVGEGPMFAATPKGRALIKGLKADTLADVVVGAAEAVGAKPWPQPEEEDRSLGRLPGLGPADYEEALASYQVSLEE